MMYPLVYKHNKKLWIFYRKWQNINPYPLAICHISIEHNPFIDDLPIGNGDVPWLC